MVEKQERNADVQQAKFIRSFQWLFQMFFKPKKIIKRVKFETMSFTEKLGPKLITSEKKIVPSTSLLEYKLIAIYLGSKWSPASQAFLPKLIEFYKEMNEGEALMEVVYLSWDNSEKEFAEELDKMPWLAMAFKQKHRYSFYNEYKEILPGLPSLLIFNSHGELVEEKGRRELELNKEEFTKKLKDFLYTYWPSG